LTRLAIPLEGRGLELTFQKGLPLAWADPSLLERVVKNLLVAAIKHSPVGSAIQIRAVAADAQIRMSVSDHGAGIATACTRWCSGCSTTQIDCRTWRRSPCLDRPR
jgi:signal transduction histidine kinase